MTSKDAIRTVVETGLQRHESVDQITNRVWELVDDTELVEHPPVHDLPVTDGDASTALRGPEEPDWNKSEQRYEGS